MTQELSDPGFVSAVNIPSPLATGADSGLSTNSIHINHPLPNGGAVVEVEPSCDIENLNFIPTINKRKAVEEEAWVANKKPRTPLYVTL